MTYVLGGDVNPESSTEGVSDTCEHDATGRLSAVFNRRDDGLTCSCASGQFCLGDSCGSTRVVNQFGKLEAGLGLDGSPVVLGSLGLGHGGQRLLPDLLPRGGDGGAVCGGAHDLLPFFSSVCRLAS